MKKYLDLLRDVLENGEVKFDLWAMDNFVLKGYNPYPPIKAPLSVGV